MGVVTFLRSQKQEHAQMLTHNHGLNAEIISSYAYACVGHVYVNTPPAGTAFKCQTFNLFHLTLGDIKACQSLRAEPARQNRWKNMKTCPRKRNKMPSNRLKSHAER